MAIFNLRRKELQAKIVYYGPGLSGKTTNLQFIHERLKSEHKGELMTLSTQTDRTLFFDFLPVELGEIRGLKTRFQLYTVPGQVYYNSTRKLVLKNCDGIVFVADSRESALGDNLESLSNLEQNLNAYGQEIADIPMVLQYNKRDAENALDTAELDRHLNPLNLLAIPAQAPKGAGVLDTLSAICKGVIKNLRDKDPSQFETSEDQQAKAKATVAIQKEARLEARSQATLANAPVSVNTSITRESNIYAEPDTPYLEPGGVVCIPVDITTKDGGQEKITIRLTLSRTNSG